MGGNYQLGEVGGRIIIWGSQIKIPTIQKKRTRNSDLVKIAKLRKRKGHHNLSQSKADSLKLLTCMATPKKTNPGGLYDVPNVMPHAANAVISTEAARTAKKIKDSLILQVVTGRRNESKGTKPKEGGIITAEKPSRASAHPPPFSHNLSQESPKRTMVGQGQ